MRIKIHNLFFMKTELKSNYSAVGYFWYIVEDEESFLGIHVDDDYVLFYSFKGKEFEE